jgi:DNA processing protein
VKAVGKSLNKANIKGKSIKSGDYAVIDSNLQPRNGDYVLSSNQIQNNYDAGFNNHSLQIIDYHETSKSENWTVAVIGSGFDHMYPSENIALAERIANQGAVLSEFPFTRKPDKTTFPMRNRIVSGMSKGVLVVEAGRRSGAAITANQALSQGRSVFAVPGRIDSYLSVGTNALIKEGAYLVTDVQDILEHFEMLFPKSLLDDEGKRPVNLPDLSEDETKIVKLLAKGEMGVDLLIRQSGISTAKVASVLIALELKKIVRMLPGRKVELIG